MRVETEYTSIHADSTVRDEEARSWKWKRSALGVTMVVIFVMVALTMMNWRMREEPIEKHSAMKVVGKDQVTNDCAKQYYFMATKSKSIPEAEALCASTGGQLASIATSAQNGKATAACGSDKCFIGLVRNPHTTARQWLDSSAGAPYTNWASGEPSGDWREPCSEIYSSSGKWNDIPCQISASTAKAAVCMKPQVSPYVKKKTFYLADGARTAGSMAEAEIMCVGAGGSIATIASAEENTAATSACTGGDCYIGLVQLVNTSGFTWVDGSALGYTNWAPGEPSGNEACVMMYDSGKWNDLPCLGFAKKPLCQAM